MRNNYFKENGYKINKTILDDDDCDKLIKTAYSLKNRDDFSPLMHPHRKKGGEMFFEIIKKETIINMIKNEIGKKINLLQTQFFFMPPKTPGFAPHQDDWYVRSSDYEGFISLWIPLVDVSKKNGCLIIYEKSHKNGIFDVKVELKKDINENIDENGTRIHCNPPQKFKRKNLLMNKGDGLLIHSRAIHSSYKNNSTNLRYAILYTFIRKGLKFNKGNSSKRVAVPINY